MSKQKTVYEIAIMGRVTWNLHSLNNEGSVGNVVEPRTLKLADGTTTDGISGEMLKHIHVARLWELEADKSLLSVTTFAEKLVREYMKSHKEWFEEEQKRLQKRHDEDMQEHYSIDDYPIEYDEDEKKKHIS